MQDNRYRQSELSAWQRCRRKYTMRYTNNVVPVSIGPRRPASGKRDAGSAAHIGVAAINNGLDLSVALQLVTNYVNELRAVRNDDELPPLTKEDDKEWWEIERLAQAITTNYVSWGEEGNDVGVVYHCVEQAWEVTIPGTDYIVYGMLDAALYDPLVGGDIIRDNKSVASFHQTPEEVDFQLRTYAWAWWRMTGVVPKRAEHLMMKRVLGGNAAKPPFFERVPIGITERILIKHEQVLIARCDEIAAHQLPLDDAKLWPNPTKDCSWDCSYRAVCPAIDDGSDWEYMLESEFVTPSDVE